MDLSAAALRRFSTASGTCKWRRPTDGTASATARVRVPARAACGVKLCDEAYLRYYDDDEEKKRGKLVKSLRKDLARLQSLRLPLPADQTHKIAETAQQLLEQLNQIRVEEKEMKKKKKEERKNNRNCRGDSSSFSSSESSDSDCNRDRDEPQILQLSDLKTSTAASIAVPNPVTLLPLAHPLPLPPPAPAPAPAPAQAVVAQDGSLSGKIEVCMGGKCKKSGSMDLLREFEKKASSGSLGAVVVGCKCMGKCKEGPNVRFFGCAAAPPAPGRVLRDQLCVGVGLEDVGPIVAHFFGEEERDDTGCPIVVSAS